MPPSVSGSTSPRAMRGRCPRSSEALPSATLAAPLSKVYCQRFGPRCDRVGRGGFMTKSYLPPTQEIHALFIDEVSAMGCVCPDVYDDGMGLYARAFFSAPVEVRPGDAVQGGVALRTVGEFVDVHPFVYRQV